MRRLLALLTSMSLVFGGVAVATAAATATAAQATPSPSRIVSTTYGRLFVMNADGSDRREIHNGTTTLESGAQVGLYAQGPRLSPDGKQIAFAGRVPVVGEDIYVINVDGTGLRKVTANAERASQPAWSPDGMRLAYLTAEFAIATINVDGTDSAVQVPPSAWSPSTKSIVWSPDGSSLAYITLASVYDPECPGGQRQLPPLPYTVGVDSIIPPSRILIDEEGLWAYQSLDWSPAGFAVVRTSTYFGGCQVSYPENTRTDLFVSDSDGYSVEELTRTDAQEHLVAWSPDGTEVATREGFDYVFYSVSDGTSRRLPGAGVFSNEAFDWGPLDGTPLVDPCPGGTVAPNTAPAVTVTREPTGYRVTWTEVPGATGYRIYVDRAVGHPDDAGYVVTSSRLELLADVGCSLREFRTDLLTADSNLNPHSAAFSVLGYNTLGMGPRHSGRAGCAPAYFIAARGSGQNPYYDEDGRTIQGSYASGLGSRALNVYEDVRQRLKLSQAQFQANAINYPARGVTSSMVDRKLYRISHSGGVAAAATQLRQVPSSCPDALIVAMGYSQGAHAIGDAFNGLSGSEKGRIASLQLTADAKRNHSDKSITHMPRVDILEYRGLGVMGARAPFTNTSRAQVVSWCYWGDMVCNSPFGTNFHGPEYDCYEKWTALAIAERARSQGWYPLADVAHPTCEMAK